MYIPKESTLNIGEQSSLRNICAGLINRKELNKELEFVHFISYQALINRLDNSEFEQIQQLAFLGFPVVPCWKVTSLEDIRSIFQKYLTIWRKNWLYETDGLVITVDDSQLFNDIDNRWEVNHHHHYAIAIKPPAEGGETKLQEINWQMSRQGKLIPVAIFDPIVLKSVQIQRATLHNYRFMKNLQLCVNDILYIERANEVIPYVKSNLSCNPADTFRNEKAQFFIPTTCPYCNTPLQEEGVHLLCSYTGCAEKSIQKIIYWVKQANIEQVAEKTIRALFNAHIITSILDLYSLSKETLLQLEGFAEKKSLFFSSRARKVENNDHNRAVK